jgi:hypothetical protein
MAQVKADVSRPETKAINAKTPAPGWNTERLQVADWIEKQGFYKEHPI